MTVPERPKALISAIAKGKCVGFVGAGLSKAAGLPDWEELLLQMIQWCEENDLNLQRSDLPGLIKDKKYLDVAEHLEEHLGENNLRECLKSIFGRQTYLPTETHHLLTRLPFCAALTTNFDSILESAYGQRLTVVPKTITFKNSSELMSLLREDEFYILKTHGTINEIETVILGRKKFRRLIHKENAYAKHLQTLLLTKTFFFIGFSLSDQDLLILLDELFETSNGPDSCPAKIEVAIGASK